MAEQKKKIKVTVKKESDPAPQAEIVCPECGSINSSDSRFCSQCGNKLQKDVSLKKATVSNVTDRASSENQENTPRKLGGNLGASLGRTIKDTLFTKEEETHSAGSEESGGCDYENDYDYEYGNEYDYGYDRGPSDGISVLDVVETFATVSAARNIGKMRKAQERLKPDLIGTAGCNKGKKDESGFSTDCPGCPLYSDCRRGSSKYY